MTSFGSFIQPDAALAACADPATMLDIATWSGYKSRDAITPYLGHNKIFDGIASKITQLDLNYEDQCSVQYYYDLVLTLRDFNGEFNRLVEVGVFMGGATSYLAGCVEPFDFDLDLVDINTRFLLFTYERVRRLYPEAAKRIRLFHGDLASYTRHVMLEDQDSKYIVHHDGSHEFNQVVRDMSALYYAREKVLAIIAQDTHLRGTINNMNFVDMALYAVFGTDLSYASIGTVYTGDTEMTRPNIVQGNYFMPGVAEGIVLPMATNNFIYPHPALSIDDFLPSARIMAAAA